LPEPSSHIAQLKSAHVVNYHLLCDPTIWQPGFDHPRQQWSRCLQKEMAIYKHWSVSLRTDPDDVPHCWILSSDKAKWRLILATVCRWRCSFLADQLWFMTRNHAYEKIWWKMTAVQSAMPHLAGARFTSQWQQSNQQCLTWQVVASLVGVTLVTSWWSSAGSSCLSRSSISSSLRCSSSVGQYPSPSRLNIDTWHWSTWSSLACYSTHSRFAMSHSHYRVHPKKEATFW